jgi:hypothetical protein
MNRLLSPEVFGTSIACVTMAMTKLEFITALYQACPAFMRDHQSYVNCMEANIKVPLLDRAKNEIIQKSEEFYNKWPRARHFAWRAPGLSTNDAERIRRLKKSFEILILADKANVEIDPYLSPKIFFGAIKGRDIKRLVAEGRGFKRGKMPVDPLSTEIDKKFSRRRGGENLFSEVAFVIRVYPDTNKDDIDWEAIEQLKKHFYGKSYRPKPDQYEKIIKVFQAGQLLEEKKAYKSWQEVAKSVGLQLSTVRYIYDKAHQLVFGFPATKRHYDVEEEVSVPETPQDIPLDPGPKLRELLTNNGEIGEYKNVFDELEDIDPEKCHMCKRLVARLSGKYLPHDNGADDEIFVCDNCLSPSS